MKVKIYLFYQEKYALVISGLTIFSTVLLLTVIVGFPVFLKKVYAIYICNSGEHFLNGYDSYMESDRLVNILYIWKFVHVSCEKFVTKNHFF